MATNVTQLGEIIRRGLSGRNTGSTIENALKALNVATDGTQEASKFIVNDANANQGIINAASISLGTSGSEVLQPAALAIPVLATISDTAIYDVGRTYTAPDGKVYVFIEGVASTVAGDWLQFTVTSTAGSTTTRAVANGKGPLGVAIGALVNTKFGWVQVAGLNLAAGAISGGDAAAGAALYLTATPGLLDDQFVDGDMLFGALSTVQEGETAGNPAALMGVWLAYPTTNDLDIVS